MWRCVHTRPWTKHPELMTPALGLVGSSADKHTHSDNWVIQGQLDKLLYNYSGPTRPYTDRKALYTSAYHTVTLQWESVSKPTSSPLAIIFLCVSASVSTGPFTPNNWKSTITSICKFFREWGTENFKLYFYIYTDCREHTDPMICVTVVRQRSVNKRFISIRYILISLITNLSK